MKSKPLFFTACALLLAAFSPRLALAADGDHLLPGNALTIKQAVKQSRLIVEADLVDLGPATPAAPGQTTYRKATFNIYGYLKGQSESPIRVFLTVDAKESSPKKERHYILFVNNLGKQSITSGANKPLAIKLLPADPAHISQVANIVAALSQ